MQNEKVRVLSEERKHAWWSSREEALRLVRAGHARSYGTHKRMLGVILLVSEAQAGTFLFGLDAVHPAIFHGCAGGDVVREHIAHKWYVWAFRGRAAA